MEQFLEKLNHAIEWPTSNYALNNALCGLEGLLKHCKSERAKLRLKEYIAVLKNKQYGFDDYIYQPRIPEFVLLCKTIQVFIAEQIRRDEIA